MKLWFNCLSNPLIYYLFIDIKMTNTQSERQHKTHATNIYVCLFCKFLWRTSHSTQIFTSLNPALELWKITNAVCKSKLCYCKFLFMLSNSCRSKWNNSFIALSFSFVVRVSVYNVFKKIKTPPLEKNDNRKCDKAMFLNVEKTEQLVRQIKWEIFNHSPYSCLLQNFNLYKKF